MCQLHLEVYQKPRGTSQSVIKKDFPVDIFQAESKFLFSTKCESGNVNWDWHYVIQYSMCWKSLKVCKSSFLGFLTWEWKQSDILLEEPIFCQSHLNFLQKLAKTRKGVFANTKSLFLIFFPNDRKKMMIILSIWEKIDYNLPEYGRS